MITVRTSWDLREHVHDVCSLLQPLPGDGSGFAVSDTLTWLFHIDLKHIEHTPALYSLPVLHCYYQDLRPC